jgi:hypothetical protein
MWTKRGWIAEDYKRRIENKAGKIDGTVCQVRTGLCAQKSVYGLAWRQRRVHQDLPFLVSWQMIC